MFIFIMHSRLLVCLIMFSLSWWIHASEVKLTITPHTTPVFFIEGKPFTLTCTVHGNVNEKITWTKNEQTIDPVEYQIESWSDKDEEGPTMNVKLTKNLAGQSDTSNFRCSAGYMDQTAQTSGFHVFIRDANVTEGGLSTLTCKPQMDFDQKKVTWYKSKVLLTEVPDLKDRLEFGNDSVSIRNTKLTDSGVYTCRIEIGPTKDMSQTFDESVVLQGKPYIINGNNPTLNQQVTNSSITLKCPAGGHPVPEVFWFRDGEVLEPSERIHVSSNNGQASGLLQILNTTEADLAQYSCTVENALGKASMTFDLKSNGGAESGLKWRHGFLDFSLIILYISVVTMVTSWTR